MMYGGAKRKSSGYATQRATGLAHLASVKTGQTKSGLQKAAEWRQEVKVYTDQGYLLKDAMKAASLARKATNPDYVTIKEGVVGSYKGFNPNNVKCSPMKGWAAGDCPAARKAARAASTSFRPNAHPVKRAITQDTAVQILRKHYRDMGRAHAAELGVGRPNMLNKWINRSMRGDISRVRKFALTACPTRDVTYQVKKGKLAGRTITRKSMYVTPECKDSWLYRNPVNKDIKGVDNGVGKASKAYGKRYMSLGTKF